VGIRNQGSMYPVLSQRMVLFWPARGFMVTTRRFPARNVRNQKEVVLYAVVRGREDQEQDRWSTLHH
jgi:hypothetical protein